MKSLRILFFLFCFLSQGLFVNAQNWVWANLISSAGAVEIKDVKTDANDNVYVFGNYKNAITFVGSPGPVSFPDPGTKACYLAKYDKDGTLVWARQIGGNKISARAMTIDDFDNIYITGGIFTGAETFRGSATPVGDVIIGNVTSEDVYLAKYDSNGDVTWAQTVAWGADKDRPGEIIVDELGDILMIGFFNNDLIFNGGQTINETGGNTDNFVAKFDATGTSVWVRQMEGTDANSRFNSISLCSNEGYFVGGVLFADVIFEGNTLTSRGDRDGVLFKITKNGALEWIRQIGGVSADELTSIDGKDGNVYVTGYFYGTPIFDNAPTYSDQELTSNGSADIFLVKYDKDGVIQLLDQFGGIGVDRANDINTDNYVVSIAGYFSNSIDFDAYTLNTTGGQDAFVANLDLNGNTINASNTAGTGDDQTISAIIDGDNNTCFAGEFLSPTLTIGADVLTNGGAAVENVFIGKLINIYLSSVIADNTCYGDSNGEIDLTVSGGGASPYTFNWEDAAVPAVTISTNEDLTGLVAGTYNVTVTDANLAITVGSFVVSEPVAVAAPVADNDSCCFGEATPDLDAIGSNIIWYREGALVTVLGTGNTYATGEVTVGIDTFYVTQTVSGCESVADTVVLTIKALSATPSVNDTIICFGAPSPKMAFSGTNVKWYNDSLLTVLVGAGDTLVTSHADAGIYTYYVTQTANGCESLPDTVDITIQALPSAPAATSQVVCFGSAVLDLTAVGSNNTWYSDLALTVVETTGNTFTTGKTAAGIYTYYVTETVGTCESPATTVTLTINALPDVPIVNDDSICFGEPMIALTAIGSNIKWYAEDALSTLLVSGNSYTSPATVVGTYTYYLTDSLNGCISDVDSVKFSIKALSATPTVSDTTICFGAPSPKLGFAGTNVKWYNDSLLSVLVASGDSLATSHTNPETYTYYVTQTANGCESIPDTVDISILSVSTAPVTTSQEICLGVAVPDLTTVGTKLTWYSDFNLSAQVGTGNTFATGETATGVYNYYVTDTVGDCQTAAAMVTLSIRELPVSTLLGTDVACNSDITGSIDLKVSGGNAPYAYNWSNAETTEDIDSLAAGWYKVTVTDNNFCEVIDSTEINNSQVMSLTFITKGTTVAFDDGDIDLIVTGGSLPYSYNWSNGATIEDVTNLTLGKYTVTVTDNNLCTGIDSTTILDESNPLSLTFAATIPTCVDSADGSIDLTVAGGVTPITYLWSKDLITTEDIDSLLAGVYTVTVTDGNGIVAIDSIDIMNPVALSVNFTTTQVTCAGGADGKLHVSAVGGTSPYTYLWSKDSITTTSIENLSEGWYKVTVADAKDCIKIDSAQVSSLSPLSAVTLSSEDLTCAGDSNGVITVTSANGVRPYSYEWSTSNSTDSTIINAKEGSNYVTVTDACNNTVTDFIELEAPEAMTLTFTSINPSEIGVEDGSVEVAVAAGTSPYIFAWSNGDREESISDLDTGKYVVVVTDMYDCAVTDSVVLTALSGSIAIYSAFTPNADGANDVWNIKNIEFYPECTVNIFNQWGIKVFESKGYSVSWDGKDGDKELPSGTYFYVIDLGDDDTKPYTGPVTIIK